MITLDSVLSQPAEQLATEVDGEVLMMNIESGNYFGLNEVASFIWRQLETPMSARALCAAIAGEFDVPSEQCEADTLAFLDGMVKDGLLQQVDASAGQV